MDKVDFMQFAMMFFVYVIISLILYMIVRDIANYMFEKKVIKLKGTFGEQVRCQLERYNSEKNLSKIELDYISQCLTKKTYKKVFDDVIIDFNKIDKNRKITKMYMDNFENIITSKLRKSYKMNNVVLIYNIAMIGEYGILNYEIKEFLRECVKKDSRHLRYVALKSICKIGDEKNLAEALKCISDENKYISKECLISYQEDFSGDKNNLNKALICIYGYLNKDIKRSIDKYLENKIIC